MMKMPLETNLHEVKECGTGKFYNIVDATGREIEAPELCEECNAFATARLDFSYPPAAGPWQVGEPGSRNQSEIWLFAYGTKDDMILKTAWWDELGKYWTSGRPDRDGRSSPVENPDYHSQIFAWNK